MNSKQKPLVQIGTSGIVLPGNKSTFPAEFQSGTRLHYYANLFNSLEINASFYKIPKRSTFEKWANEVPPDFTFSVKLWRGITHTKKLEYVSDDIIKFMFAANGLGKRAGCLLIQFPASIRLENHRNVEKILQELQECNQSSQWQLAVEFRHTSWYQPIVYSMLEKYGAILVLHDMPHSAPPIDHYSPRAPSQKSLYLRFHGPTGQYTGSYSHQYLDEYAKRINEYRAAGKDVYVYLNNTIGSALLNAQYLQQRLLEL